MGPLLDLPTKQLGRRFGKTLLTYLGQLTGTLPDPRTAIVPANDFKETLHLLQPISDKQDLYARTQSPMQQLGQELQQWLITHQYGCERVAWRFLSHKSHAEVVIRFAQAKQNARDILRISELKLESEDLPTEVLSIELRSLRLRRWDNHSQNLFNFHTGQQLENEGLNSQAYELVSEVNARLGDHICRGIDVLDQHSPESAWCHTALTALHRSSTTLESPNIPRRPLWLFDPPRQVPRTDLVLLHGPERIQSSWWQAETTSRDYYIARHQQGSECWAYREYQGQQDVGLKPNLNTNIQEKWYLHGYFG
ncbi:MAG: hypothetical protein GKR90_04895 [Pseudomonadales bacterium]|nr:hypothetical protein [Pseudomonadales bacterium]